MKKLWIMVLLLALCAGCGTSQTQDGDQTAPGTEVSQTDGYTEGKYFIDVDSSSAMFKVVSAVLNVENGEMTADLTLSGQGYGYLYMGTGEEAQQAPAEEYITYTEGADGAYTYTVPVAALDQEIDCAAWSIKKEAWYDRVLVFRSETIRPWVEDGTYTVEATLEGGGGKSTIASPLTLIVANGQMTARIEWSSPYYDYMILDFVEYLPVNEEGNSVFEIPVKLDTPMEITADTVAMSEPHEIDYVLTISGDSMEKV